MRERLPTLVPHLKQAADRRSGWAAEDRSRLDEALLVITADYATDSYDSNSHASSSYDSHLSEPAINDADRRGPTRDRFAALTDVFDLDELDQALLLIALAPEVDASFALAFGLLRGIAGPGRAGVGLALELAGVGSLDPRGVERLGRTAGLRRHGLLDVTDASSGPWLMRELAVPERVVGHLLGTDPVDPDVAAVVTHPVPLALDGVDTLAAAIENGAPLSWVRAAAGTAGLSLAAAAFTRAGLRCVCIDLDRARSSAPIAELVGSAIRQAALLGCRLVVGGADRLIVGDGANSAPALTVLDRTPVPVIAVGSRAWERTWQTRYPITVDAPVLTPADRAAAWTATGESETAGAGLAGLRLTPEAIAQTAGYARRLAAARDEPVTADLVRQAARRVGGSSAPVRNVGGGIGFDDLVLPAHVDASLRRLVGWARHRDEALSRGTLLDLGRKGAGLAALFTGGPGTGKTLAAHVVADELGIDLVQVDLSTIVDKYIGETEKNLERVFAQAESLNVVLFFDEADALFGRRTEVKDSHDRHANQEVAYLLQRMENFDGLTILATNLRGNLDVAFSRRMNFIIHFPDPDAATRHRLWASHLDRLGPIDPKDPPRLDHLAETIELSGGDIRNIVLAAGYDAAAAGVRPGMRHLEMAAVGEFQKLGRRIPLGLTPDGDR